MNINYDIIIFEGSDCAGKSTVIEILADFLNFKITKGSSFELSQCTHDELLKRFKEMTKEKMTIFDRFIYSNEVYAPLYKDYAILTDEERREIESLIKSRALLVYLEADMDVLVQRMNNRGDDYVTTDKLQSIKDGYEVAMSKQTLNHISINTSELTSEEIADMVIREVTLQYGN